ncbi:MAG: hypothetical protein ABWZ87_03955 [Aeromicrobium sp.]
MRRVLLVVPVLLAVALVTLLVSRGGSGDGRSAVDPGLTAEALPYPRSTTPLPVPEVRIGELPWRDELMPRQDGPPRIVPSPDVPPRIIECDGSLTDEQPPLDGQQLFIDCDVS